MTPIDELNTSKPARAWGLGVTRRRGLLAAAFLLAALAGPLAAGAWAAVEDPLELLGPGVRGALETELANQHAENIDVVVTTSAPAGADVEAKQRLALLKRGVDAGLVLMVMNDATVGVALGQGFVERGVTPERTRALIAEHVPPAFQRGVPTDGVIELVRAIKLAHTLGPRPGYVPPPPPPRTPWEALIGGFVLIVGAIVVTLTRRSRRRSRLMLEERVRGERGRLAKLREDMRKLAEQACDAPSTGPEAEALLAGWNEQLVPLEAEQALIREALRTLSERVEASGTAGVAEALAPLTRRIARLHMGLAALEAALGPLFATAKEVRVLIDDAVLQRTAWHAGQPAMEVRERVDGAIAEAEARLAAGDRVGARDRLATAFCRMAPADPDERWLARMADPAAGPEKASDLVARWAALEGALEAEERRDREAGRSGRDGLRGRVEELQGMLTAARPDLVRVEVLLDATERLERMRRGEQLSRGIPSGVA